MDKRKKEFCQAYIKNMGATIEDLCDMVNISYETGYKWAHDSEVKKFIIERSDTFWRMNLPKVEEQLMRCIEVGDTKAIMYFLDHTKFKDDNKNKISFENVEINILPTEDTEDED